ncbi:DNA gyrase inhibitor YacG [Pseudoalteromonas sp. NC201]|nr:DNA gyrase inhibitor YacG [Pseudoalteromonas sp. NC201]
MQAVQSRYAFSSQSDKMRLDLHNHEVKSKCIMTTTVKCPTCQQAVEWSDKSPFRPFCSKRCQLIDLGDWSDESNTISTPMKSGELTPQDAESLIEDIEAMLAKNNENFFKE